MLATFLANLVQKLLGETLLPMVCGTKHHPSRCRSVQNQPGATAGLKALTQVQMLTSQERAKASEHSVPLLTCAQHHS